MSTENQEIIGPYEAFENLRSSYLFLAQKTAELNHTDDMVAYHQKDVMPTLNDIVISINIILQVVAGLEGAIAQSNVVAGEAKAIAGRAEAVAERSQIAEMLDETAGNLAEFRDELVKLHGEDHGIVADFDGATAILFEGVEAVDEEDGEPVAPEPEPLTKP